MTEDNFKKLLTALEMYDSKIDKLENQLKRLKDKRENLHLRIISDTIKDKELSLTDFFMLVSDDKERK